MKKAWNLQENSGESRIMARADDVIVTMRPRGRVFRTIADASTFGWHLAGCGIGRGWPIGRGHTYIWRGWVHLAWLGTLHVADVAGAWLGTLHVADVAGDVAGDTPHHYWHRFRGLGIRGLGQVGWGHTQHLPTR